MTIRGHTLSPTVLGIIFLCFLVELMLQLGLVWPEGRLRQTAYEYAGFWPGLLRGWQPNYPGQATAMFFSYAFLHGGLLHLIINMTTLWSLGQSVALRAGELGFGLIYGASVGGGALGYALLAVTPQPMVGASGALFGLAGAVLAWTWQDRTAPQDGFWAIFRIAAFLMAINLVMYWALDGHLAWQTHLGGFLAGAGITLWRQDRAPEL